MTIDTFKLQSFLRFAMKYTLLASILFLSLTAFEASANSLTISCDDTDDASSCSIDSDDPDSPVKTPLINMVEQLLDVAEETPPTEYCTETTPAGSEGPSTYQCTVDELIFDCEKAADNQAQCAFGGTSDNPLISLNCSTTESEDSSSGSCLLNTDTDQMESLFDDVDPAVANGARVLASLAVVCVDQSSESALNRDCNQLISSLNDGNTDLANEIIQQITPLNADTSLTTAMTALTAQNQNISNRLSTLRSNRRNKSDGDSVDVSGLQFFDGKQFFTAQELFEGKDVQALAAAGSEDQASSSIADYGKLGFFINGTLLFGEQDATDDEGGSEFDSTGVTVGVDYRYTNDLVAGLAFGFSNTATDFTGGNTGTLDALGYNVTLYGSYFIENYYFDASLSMGGNDFEQERNIIYTGVNQVMSSEFFGNQTSLAIGGGADFAVAGWNINPFAQLASTTINVDDYQEKASNPDGAGSGWALAINSQELTSLLFNLGAQATYVFNQDWGVVIPLARLELVNELDDDERFIVGRFVGGGTVKSDDASFELKTNEVDTSYYNIGFGATVLMTNGNSGFLYYQSTVGFDDFSQNMINAGWRWEF